MKLKQEIIDKLKSYRTNIDVAKTGRLDNSNTFIQGAITALSWVLDDRSDKFTVHKIKIRE